MPRFLRDKYFLLCLTVAFVIVASTMLAGGGETERGTVGLAFGIESGTNGYVFDFTTVDGEQIRCFCREEPVEGGLYRLDGRYSDDRSIFFVSTLRALDQDAIMKYTGTM